MSPNARTAKLLRELGADAVEIVERWNAFSKTRKDLLGFADILCCLDNSIVAVQATTLDHVSERKKKISASSEAYAWQKCGGKIWVVGWAKAGPNNREKRKVGTWYSKILELNLLA